MKILWVTNTIFPDLAISIGQKPPVVGGWMYGLAKDLSKTSGIDLFVATSKNVTENKEVEISNITYFLLKGKKSINNYDTSLEQRWISIIEKIQPDVVHIHGTEYAHGLSLMNACPELKYVISIQGLISVYARYFLAGLKPIDLIRSLTFRDVLKRQTLKQQENEFYKRGNDIEKKYLLKAKNVIGRTDWDHDHTKILNSEVNYYFCNESLRDIFYESELWTPKDEKTNPIIFLSQAATPLKGLHNVLKAVYLLKKEFPKLQLRIAGGNIVKSDTFKEKLSITGYGKYIKKLLTKYDLKDQVTFTGSLNEKQMVNEYLNSSLFICPSSIENSPNSLGEAQLLGVPVIASYVGGVSNMLENEKTGLLYRFEEVEMLAIGIKRILNNSEFAKEIGLNGNKAALKRHSRSTNLKQLTNIYDSILHSNE